MNKDETTVNLSGPGEYTLRVGEALEAKHQRAISISGRLSAPFDFLEKKYFVEDELPLYDPENSHLIVNKENSQLTLVLNEKDPNSSDTINGFLVIDPKLNEWQINTSKRWTVSAFLQFVRERKYFFKDPSQHSELLASLQKWNVNVERVIKQHNSNDGNSLDSLETKVSKVEGLITKFNLDIAIYKGYARNVFSVEIGLDPKNASVEIYLFSSELFELILSEKEKLFNSELEKFGTLKFDCSIVNIS